MATVANFVRCELPERPPNHFSYSGSTYWDFGNKVIRWSDHWGPNIRSCCWFLDLNTVKLKYPICGECYYEDFKEVFLRE